MENDSKFDKFVSKLAYLVNDNGNDSEKKEEKFFGKYDIAILTFIGLLVATLFVTIAMRFVVQPPYWHLVDLFSIILLVILTYFIVIRKLLKKK